MNELFDNWHNLSVQEVLEKQQSSFLGLSATEARDRRQIFGANQLEVYTSESWFFRFVRQFNNVLIYILLISMFIALFLDHWADASVIFGVVIINAIVGVIQEGKAEKALDAIRLMLTPTATVIRDGQKINISAELLVPGDVVVLKNGDKIPADLRLIESKNLQLQEAILTGESLPVEKQTAVLPINTDLSDRLNMVYSGTLVVQGLGKGIVIAIGKTTEIGKISVSLTKLPRLITPLIAQLNVFGRWVTLAILLMAGITYLIGALVWQDSSAQMLMAIVGLIVAAIPEGLPAIITIILAIGVTRMAKVNAIVRRLPVVETMGAVTTICTDKTGTLTRNELAVQTVVSRNHTYEANGAVIEHADLLDVIESAVLCSDIEIIHAAKSREIIGNSIDSALTVLATHSKIDLKFLYRSKPRTDFIPYESQHKFMATLNHDHVGHGYIYIKGAPEQILALCNKQQSNGIHELEFDFWNGQINKLTTNGQRVIAVAYCPVAFGKQQLTFADITKDFIFVGLIGLIDPPRSEAVLAVQECQAAGIKVKMITGDHVATAKNIAEQIGIDTAAGTLTGQEIDALDDNIFMRTVAKINVFARTTPQHKLRLVQALQANHEVVAMTGDGVNDAPALKQADIGIAMGKKGAEIAREAATLVLADDNFATIVHAVAAGRTIYDNLKKTLLFILPVNIAQAFVVMLAIITGKLLPINAVQIMWVNMVTAITLALSLGFEPPESDIMQHPPRAIKQPILSGFLWWRIGFVSLLMVAAVFDLFVWQRRIGMDLATSRAVAVNMIVIAEAVYLLNCRRIYQGSWQFKILFGSKPMWLSIGAIVILQLFFTYVPFMQHFFATAAIGFKQWLYIVFTSVIIFGFIEVEKVLWRWLHK